MSTRVPLKDRLNEIPQRVENILAECLKPNATSTPKKQTEHSGRKKPMNENEKMDQKIRKRSRSDSKVTDLKISTNDVPSDSTWSYNETNSSAISSPISSYLSSDSSADDEIDTFQRKMIAKFCGVNVFFNNDNTSHAYDPIVVEPGQYSFLSDKPDIADIAVVNSYFVVSDTSAQLGSEPSTSQYGLTSVSAENDSGVGVSAENTPEAVKNSVGFVSDVPDSSLMTLEPPAVSNEVGQDVLPVDLSQRSVILAPLLYSFEWFNARDGQQVRTALFQAGVCATQLIMEQLWVDPNCYKQPLSTHFYIKNVMQKSALRPIMFRIGFACIQNPTKHQAYKMVHANLRRFSGSYLFLRHALDHGHFPPNLMLLQKQAEYLKGIKYSNKERVQCIQMKGGIIPDEFASASETANRVAAELQNHQDISASVEQYKAADFTDASVELRCNDTAGGPIELRYRNTEFTGSPVEQYNDTEFTGAPVEQYNAEEYF